MVLSIREEVQGLVNRIEWNKFLGLREPTIKRLLLKFLATYNFHKLHQIDYDWEGTIKLRLGGLRHSMSISEFGVNYRFYKEEFLDTEKYQTSAF